MNKIFSFFILLVLFFLAGCTKKNIFVINTQTESNLKVGMIGNPDLNWVFETTKQDQIVSLIQRPLLDLRIIKGKLQITSSLLDKGEFISPTSFKLSFNQDVYWEGKEKLGASHLIHSWKELLQSYPDNANASLLFCITNAKNFAERRVLFSSVGISSSNEQSVELKFHTPCPNFPYLLSHLSLSPRLNYSWSIAKGNLLPRPLDTLGDWKIVTHWPKKEIDLQLTKRRFDKEASYKLDNLKISFWKEKHEAMQLFEDKQLDVVLGDSGQFRNFVSTSESFPTLNTAVLVFNSYRKPFQNKKVREMFGMAIQKEELLRLMGTTLDETHRLLPFLNGTVEKQEFSLSSAKKILTEIKLGGALALSVPKDPFLMDIAQNLVAQWKKNLGVDVEIISTNIDNPMMTLKKFRPNFYKKALGLEEWVEFSSSDFLSPVLSSLASDISIEPFKLYEDRLIKMEQWAVAEEKLVVPLVTFRKTAYLRKGITGLQYKQVQDVFDFNSIEKN